VLQRLRRDGHSSTMRFFSSIIAGVECFPFWRTDKARNPVSIDGSVEGNANIISTEHV